MRTELSSQPRVVGAKQVRRAVEAGQAKVAILADDADPRIGEPITALCKEKGVPLEGNCSMKELGRCCGIAVGAAVAALIEA